MRISPVKKGDIVDVVAPASACSRAELQAGIRFLKSLGLRPRVPHDIFGKAPVVANTDAIRLKHLKRAIYAKDSSIIWCIRGGYGALRLMPEIRQWKKPKRGKIFLGYSDMTSLHAHFNLKWNWPTLHGTLLCRAGSGRMSAAERRTLLNLIFGKMDSVTYNGLTPLNSAARKKHTVRGPVWGGNMVVLQSSLGTAGAFDPKGCILFFEETGEWPYRMDRMLVQFEQAGWLKKAKAVVFGDCLLNDAKARRVLWGDVIHRFAQRQKIPVFKGVPAGHDVKRQMPLPFNTSAKLVGGKRGHLEIPSGILGASS
ncbi:MAG: LD-carboxypeptidase [Bdellovibrionales bacterium]